MVVSTVEERVALAIRQLTLIGAAVCAEDDTCLDDDDRDRWTRSTSPRGRRDPAH